MRALISFFDVPIFTPFLPPPRVFRLHCHLDKSVGGFWFHQRRRKKKRKNKVFSFFSFSYKLPYITPLRLLGPTFGSE
jgi:hypothetical protein